MYGFFRNRCIDWRGSSISEFCTLGSLFHFYKQLYVMLDSFEWVMELLDLLSVYSSLNYIAYSQLIEHFLIWHFFGAITNIYLVEGEGEEEI
jgi:hypothetical protein